VLAALGIQWSGTSGHIACPYPDHPDRDPSWRWDDKRKVAFCTCVGTRPAENKAHTIFGVVGAKEGLDREAAKKRVAEIIGRTDLITGPNGRKYQRTDADALLNPASDNRNDAFAWSYLGQRLGVNPKRVPRPSTKPMVVRLRGRDLSGEQRRALEILAGCPHGCTEATLRAHGFTVLASIVRAGRAVASGAASREAPGQAAYQHRLRTTFPDKSARCALCTNACRQEAYRERR
jgi:hypothetical protein